MFLVRLTRSQTTTATIFVYPSTPSRRLAGRAAYSLDCYIMLYNEKEEPKHKPLTYSPSEIEMHPLTHSYTHFSYVNHINTPQAIHSHFGVHVNDTR